MTEEPRAGEPALTNAEWANCATGEGNVYLTGTSEPEVVVWDCALGDRALVQRRHALAALCLHGQSYGFSWEDVDALHLAADACEDACASSGEQWAKAVLAVADRIAALLPPRA